ncbi:MAG: phenylalanine--tRNA ligase subunit beta [Nitrososphaera sp.]
MPVVNLTKSRLEEQLPEIPLDRLLEALPFIGLDIEGEDETAIRVEYNPNRPDYSSQYGIVRALKGLLEIEIGMPKLAISGSSGVSIKVEPAAAALRPFVVALAATGGRLDDDDIRQLVAMQEDLHNGLGRKRRKASIGVHNMDRIRPPLLYKAVDSGFSFVPLGETKKMSMLEVLEKTDTGITYAPLASDWKERGSFPIICDSRGTVLSFPPIINGADTQVDVTCRNLLVEVTATSRVTALDILAVIGMNLSDAGFKIRSVKVIERSKAEITPEFRAKKIFTTPTFLNQIVGTSLSPRQVLHCLKKCRLGASLSGKRIVCTIPRYRTDIQSEIDLAEELSIGYGIQNLLPSLPSVFSAGSRSLQSMRFDAIRSALVGLGMIENLSFSLTGQGSGDGPVSDTQQAGARISVDSSKSAEHVLLRSSLVPSLLQALSRNVHEHYPQRLFEIGRVFTLSESNAVSEKWMVAAAICHPDADFVEALSSARAVLELSLGLNGLVTRRLQDGAGNMETLPSQSSLYINGRHAELVVGGKNSGHVGEIAPAVLEALRLRMPASVFELDLSAVQEKTNT